MANIVDATDLTKKQVVAVFAALAGEINANLGAGGPGRFTISGLCKVGCARLCGSANKTTGPREVRNPRKGEKMMSQPKPARKIVRVRPLPVCDDEKYSRTWSFSTSQEAWARDNSATPLEFFGNESSIVVGGSCGFD